MSESYFRFPPETHTVNAARLMSPSSTLPTPQPHEFEQRTRETPGRREFEVWVKKKSEQAIDAAIGGEDERVRSVNSGKAQVWRELVKLFLER